VTEATGPPGPRLRPLSGADPVTDGATVPRARASATGRCHSAGPPGRGPRRGHHDAAAAAATVTRACQAAAAPLRPGGRMSCGLRLGWPGRGRSAASAGSPDPPPQAVPRCPADSVSVWYAAAGRSAGRRGRQPQAVPGPAGSGCCRPGARRGGTAWKNQNVMLHSQLKRPTISTLFQRPSESESEGVGKCDFRVTAGGYRF
jgi:hypothetical protein